MKYFIYGESQCHQIITSCYYMKLEGNQFGIDSAGDVIAADLYQVARK